MHETYSYVLINKSIYKTFTHINLSVISLHRLQYNTVDI